LGKSFTLIAAFAALLSVISLASLAVWRNARTAQARAATLRAAELENNNALSTIRANTYLTAVLRRDYLLDASADRQKYVDRFAEIRARTMDAFHTLEATAQDASEKAALHQLRMELDLYLDPKRVAGDWTPREREQRLAEILGARSRQREEILGLAARVEQLISENSIHERERRAAADQDFQTSLGWTAGFAFVLALGISGATLMRMIRLERQSDAAQSALRQLSVDIRTTQERERKLLSRELHDQVGQMLTGLRMELASLAHMAGSSQRDLTERIGRAKTTVEHALGAVRNIAMLLRPSMLDDLGLTPALAWLVKEVSRSSGMEIHCDADPALESLPDAHRTCIYRVVQEALTNASRHSGARKVDVTVKGEPEWVIALIADDGRGFDVGSERRRGLGLLGMEERVRELGGNIRVVSSLGRGVQIEIRLPRPAPVKEENVKDFDRGRSRDRADWAKTAL
jgi:signal transduction histidine kinase